MDKYLQHQKEEYLPWLKTIHMVLLRNAERLTQANSPVRYQQRLHITCYYILVEH